MSYILDALKKSEQQKREREGGPSADMTPLLMTPAAAQSPRLPLGLIVAGFGMVALVLAVGVLLWLPGTHSNDVSEPSVAIEEEARHNDTSVQPSAVAESKALEAETDNRVETNPEPVVLNAPPKPAYITAVPAPVAAPVSKPAPVANAQAQVETQPEPAEPVQTQLADREVEHSSGQSQEQPEEQAVTEDVSVERPSAERPSIERRVLPPMSSLLKIPDLIISSHIYSQDASSRSVNMNGRNWYEGEFIAPGVVLDKITETGILLDVDGFPFPVHRNNGWQSISD